jgi:hypothetical protein
MQSYSSDGNHSRRHREFIQSDELRTPHYIGGVVSASKNHLIQEL